MKHSLAQVFIKNNIVLFSSSTMHRSCPGKEIEILKKNIQMIKKYTLQILNFSKMENNITAMRPQENHSISLMAVIRHCACKLKEKLEKPIIISASL